ncbi:hypothetical protein Rhopal_001921-T1 [Rhodotorula paludigena]|uniref:Uncharacterized protein n=1 Tax=Rhodotorula paludigena TaxID=86838 RepID=A0AAV5GHF4_9BASI|nr:hypothetical protein Rhopal_001921-T1 [Rhodotorula paludigena]
MTTPAPELPKHYLERCAVCGEPTKNRCSACFQAGMPLFFCSVEHQKLVVIDVPHLTVDPEGNPTVDPKIRCKSTPEEFLCGYMGLQRVPGCLNEQIIPMLCSNAYLGRKQVWLELVRTLTYTATATQAGNAKSVPFSELSVWHHVTSMEMMLRNVARPERTELTCGDFYRFRHHAVILVCLLRLKLADPSSIPDNWIHRATEHLMSTTNDVVTFSEITDLPKSKELVHAFCDPISAVVPLRHDSGFFIGMPGTFEMTCW